MTKSRAQLVERALQKLGAIGAGQAAAAEDSQLVNGEVVPMMDDLMARGVYAWGDPDEIDDAAFIHLSDLLANSVARSFGGQQSEEVRQMAERRLKLLDRQLLSGQPLKTTYY